MDVVSHGLWGGAAFVKKSRKSFWLAFSFGVFPDLAAFSWFFISYLLRNGFVLPDFHKLEQPHPDLIPPYVHTIYNYSHSFIIFGLAFLIVWTLLKRPVWEMLAWGLHIFMDIFTHSYKFFPTPFLYPVAHLEVNGVPWSNPVIFFTNWILLFLIYGRLLFWKKLKTRD